MIEWALAVVIFSIVVLIPGLWAAHEWHLEFWVNALSKIPKTRLFRIYMPGLEARDSING